MIFAHPFSDIVITKALEPIWRKKGITKVQETLIWVTGIGSTIFPDIDLAYAYLFGINHRFLITHTFVPYFIAAIIVLLLSFALSSKLKRTMRDYLKPEFIRMLILIGLVGVAMHLITDMLGAPVKLFYPISNNIYSVFEINSFLNLPSLHAMFQYYTTPVFLVIELFWIISGSYIFSKIIKTNSVSKVYLPKVLGIAATSALAMFILFLFIVK